MNGLALCAGVGCLELGLRLAIRGYRTVAYVEREAYAAGILAARIADGPLDEGHIWDELATFDGLPWRGRVDIASAGFPCQPFSQAGRGKGIADPRYLWPRIAEIVRDVRPGYVFLENSPRIRKEALGIMLADLSRAGFYAEWDVFSAAEEGYPHLRKRFFLLAAHPDRARQQQPGGVVGEVGRRPRDRGEETVADAFGLRGIRPAAARPREEANRRTGDSGATDAPHTSGARCSALRQRGVPPEKRHATASGDCVPAVADPDEFHDDGGRYGAGAVRRERPAAADIPRGEEGPDCSFWCAQSGVCVLDDGTPYRLDRLRAIGNGVVPAVVARAWRVLSMRL